MPRLPPHLVTTARAQHPLLPLLLRQTRTLPLALSELRWLREYISQLPNLTLSRQHDHLRHLCRRRSLGAPLQYLLKSQPFGDVDILCGKGALIPRPETEETVVRLFSLLESQLHKNNHNNALLPTDRELRVLDLCTGPGSITLLAASNLYQLHLPRGFRVLGVDISRAALTLARRSLKYNITTGALPPAAKHSISFITADILNSNTHAAIEENFGDGSVDIVIANPPYVSLEGYWKDTSRSVRLYEPEMALVPPSGRDGVRREDVFYPAIESLSRRVHARAVVLETGGDEQSARVEQLFEGSGWRTGVWVDFAGVRRNVVAWGDDSWSWLATSSHS
ncbi:hypothetical protein TWF696_007890 [Orbilia brochopaga]|uniref:Ribosomal RNA methyltransferase FtsJ domain-containing protein n=1 Tax=Orbilia brochopaga TaxID=3140254 RepID=A0AAV9UMZ5_9PEZI